VAKCNPDRVTRQSFTSLSQLNRYRKIVLGLPLPLARFKVPWGYFPSPEDPKWLLPDENALRLLLKAKEYLVTCSLKEVATWLSAESKVSISIEGLRNILRERCPLPEIMLEYNDRLAAYNNLSA